MSIAKKSAENISKVLIEALPYIQKFSGKTIVIKYGGSAMSDAYLRKSFARDIVLMKTVGINPIIVHGGGPQIQKGLKRAKIESEFIGGVRVTSPEIINTVQKVLDNEVNKEIKELINSWGGYAQALSGKRSSFIKAQKNPTQKRLGEVGEILSIQKKLITNTSNKKIPVISPIGWDKNGNPLNINADYVACYVAGALKAEKIILMTDVSGIKDSQGKKISEMNLANAKKIFKDKKSIKGGMLPKLSSVISSLEKGVSFAHVVDGRVPHAVLLEILTNKGVGTLISK
ncbi:acetylglutamate kinase [SAR86 cluster bacterium]|nr:acetylglutamate kinase [SAR86 cluster bacterium]